MTHLDYGIFDCDTHCYEPRDAFTRYLPESSATGPSPRCATPTGDEVILAGNRVATFNSESGLGFDMAYRPGIAQGDAQADGVGQPGRDLRARADPPRVPRTRAAPAS